MEKGIQQNQYEHSEEYRNAQARAIILQLAIKAGIDDPYKLGSLMEFVGAHPNDAWLYIKQLGLDKQKVKEAYTLQDLKVAASENLQDFLLRAPAVATASSNQQFSMLQSRPMYDPLVGLRGMRESQGMLRVVERTADEHPQEMLQDVSAAFLQIAEYYQPAGI